MTAKCGHDDDLFAKLAGTYCRKCADAGFKAVTGKKPKKRN